MLLVVVDDKQAQRQQARQDTRRHSAPNIGHPDRPGQGHAEQGCCGKNAPPTLGWRIESERFCRQYHVPSLSHLRSWNRTRGHAAFSSRRRYVLGSWQIVRYFFYSSSLASGAACPASAERCHAATPATRRRRRHVSLSENPSRILTIPIIPIIEGIRVREDRN